MPDIPIARREFQFAITAPASGGAFTRIYDLLTATQLSRLGALSVVDGYVIAPTTDAVHVRDRGTDGNGRTAADLAANTADYNPVGAGVAWPMPSEDWLRRNDVRMATNFAATVRLIVYAV
jgi:hypothetical protein